MPDRRANNNMEILSSLLQRKAIELYNYNCWNKPTQTKRIKFCMKNCIVSTINGFEPRMEIDCLRAVEKLCAIKRLWEKSEDQS